jgi:hypothetical protein
MLRLLFLDVAVILSHEDFLVSSSEMSEMSGLWDTQVTCQDQIMWTQGAIAGCPSAWHAYHHDLQFFSSPGEAGIE